MKCPHCLVEFHDKRTLYYIGSDHLGDWAIEKYDCPSPECKKLIAFLILCQVDPRSSFHTASIVTTLEGSELIFKRDLIIPKGANRPPVPIEVPDEISDDYTEACLVLPDSLKASAALSRRCLQNLLRLKAGINKGTLAIEIQQVLDSKQLPSHLNESIDAIRNIGNFAAHPQKSSSTGDIVEVEEGEAEWNLEVLEMLFDFYFVQPAKTESRRNALNSKLRDMGKPDMKQ